MAKFALVDQYGRPIDRARLTQEIAAPTLTGVRSPFAGTPADGLDPVKLATILREAAEGEPLRYFELAENIEERDLHYAAVLGTRKRSVAQIEITVEPASDAAAHIDQAGMVRRRIARDELQDEFFDILDAIGKGVSFTEIIWDTSEGQFQPARLEWRDPRFFRFLREDGATPMLRGLGPDEPLPGYKFICAKFQAKSGLPVRGGLARIAAWAWMFKAYTQRDWAIFTQTFGQPVRIGKFGAGASEADKATLFRAVANLAGDCAAIIPDSMTIEFIESKTVAASTDLYLKRSDWLDQQISKAVLGQTTSTDAVSGGHAVSKEHRMVQEDIERADAKALAAVLNRDLVRPWIDLSYGPQRGGYPKIKIGRPEQIDVKLAIDGVAALVPMGLKVSKKQFREMLGLTEPEDEDDTLTAAEVKPALPGAPPVKPPKPRLEPQSRGPGDPIGRLAFQAETLAMPASDAMIEVIRGLVMEASSLEEVRDRLLTLLPALDPTALADAMRQALVLAELTGAAEVGELE